MGNGNSIKADPAVPARAAGSSTSHGSASFSHCAGCGTRIAADAIAATIVARAGISLDFCHGCAAGQYQLDLKPEVNR